MHMAFFNDIIILDKRKDKNLKNATFLARIFPPSAGPRDSKNP